MKYNLIALACAVLLAAGLSLTVIAGPSEPDSDADGVCDDADDCVVASNSNQADSDQDGYGQVCDTDYDNNGKTDLSDFVIFKASYGGAAPTYNEQADHNCDNKIDLSDFVSFKARYGVAPGPSGLACAGPKQNCDTPVCP